MKNLLLNDQKEVFYFVIPKDIYFYAFFLVVRFFGVAGFSAASVMIFIHSS